MTVMGTQHAKTISVALIAFATVAMKEMGIAA